MITKFDYVIIGKFNGREFIVIVGLLKENPAVSIHFTQKAQPGPKTQHEDPKVMSDP